METTPSKAPDVSIVIVCMNRPDNLYPCLESIRATVHEVSYETLVVAYMYDRDALAQARADFPWVTFIESDRLRGFSENNNIALRQARGRFCFVLNDDTEMHEPVIDTLVSDFDRLPSDAAIVSPKIFSGDGSLQLCGRPEHDAWHYALQQFHLWSEKADNVSGSTPVTGSIYRTCDITGAAFLIRTEVFRELGWFDETYYFTPEDMALSTLAREKGWGVYVDAGVSLVHKWRTTASRIAPAVRPSAVRGSIIFFSRGNALRYLALGAAVWCAEMAKRLKARLVLTVSPTPENRTKYLTFKNITRSIFTRRSSREIFIRYYNELKSNG